MNKVKLPIEDIVVMVVAVLAFMVLVTIVTTTLTGRNKPGYIEQEIIPKVTVSPDTQLQLTKAPEPVVESWEFKHCTPTNKDCGRFE